MRRSTDADFDRTGPIAIDNGKRGRSNDADYKASDNIDRTPSTTGYGTTRRQGEAVYDRNVGSAASRAYASGDYPGDPRSAPERRSAANASNGETRRRGEANYVEPGPYAANTPERRRAQTFARTNDPAEAQRSAEFFANQQRDSLRRIEWDGDPTTMAQAMYELIAAVNRSIGFAPQD